MQSIVYEKQIPEHPPTRDVNMNCQNSHTNSEFGNNVTGMLLGNPTNATSGFLNIWAGTWGVVREARVSRLIDPLPATGYEFSVQC